MEISKLFSNEPLRELKTHIKVLQEFLKKEQGRNKTLKKILWKIQELSRYGKRKELSQLIDKTLNFTSDLNKSFLLTSSQVEGLSDIFSGLIKIFQNRLRLPFWKIKSFASSTCPELNIFYNTNCLRGPIDRVYRRVVASYFNTIFKRMPIDKVGFFLLEVVILRRLGVVWRRLTLTTFGKKLKFQFFLNTLAKFLIKKQKRILLWGFTLLIEFVEILQINKYRKKSNYKKNFRAISKILKFFERKIMLLLESGFFILKFSSDSLFIYEQGFLVLEKLIDSKIFNLKSASFCILQRVKTKCIKRSIICFFVKNLQTYIFKQRFKAFTLIKLYWINPFSAKQQILRSLNPIHHKISEKLIYISNLPLKIQKKFKKSAFLSLVSYVSYQISYDMLEENIISRMAEIFRSFSTKKLHKSWNIWKNSVVDLEGSFFTNSSQVSGIFLDQQKARLAFINMNLIIQRQNSLNKSQSFMIWQEISKNDAENKPIIKLKENSSLIQNSIKKKAYLPLRLNNIVLNINN